MTSKKPVIKYGIGVYICVDDGELDAARSEDALVDLLNTKACLGAMELKDFLIEKGLWSEKK